jgi:hypothetical protein
MIGSRLGRWVPLVFATMTAVDGWVVLGSMAQSTVIAAALLRRITGKVRAVAEQRGRRMDGLHDDSITIPR